MVNNHLKISYKIDNNLFVIFFIKMSGLTLEGYTVKPGCVEHDWCCEGEIDWSETVSNY